MRNTKLIIMIEGAVIAGVCVALSFIPLNTANADFDLSLGLIPLGVFALRRGLAPGMAVGFVWGLLLIALARAYFLAIPQVLLEYPVAFAFGGFGGILSGRFKRGLANEKEAAAVHAHAGAAGEARPAAAALHAHTGAAGEAGPAAARLSRRILLTVVFAGVLAAVTRWVFHFWAGLIFWMDYMPEGVNPYMFNFIANGASAAANAIMLAIVLTILFKTSRTIFIPKE